MGAHTAISTNAEPDLPEPCRDGIYIRCCIVHTYKERHIQPSSESNIRFIVVEMIKHHSHPPGSRGFSEIQQHTDPVVKLPRKQLSKLESEFLFPQDLFITGTVQ